MDFFSRQGNEVILRSNGETVAVTPWGRDSLRVRAVPMGDVRDRRFALLPPKNDPEAIAEKIVWFWETGCAPEYGRNGRAFVQERFEINRCFEKIERLFEEQLG